MSSNVNIQDCDKSVIFSCIDISAYEADVAKTLRKKRKNCDLKAGLLFVPQTDDGKEKKSVA